MPGTAATGSTKIAIVDSKIIANLCDGKFYIDATPAIYIGSGHDTILGANVKITNPYGVVVKPYGTNYEIAPGLSGGMDAAISFNIPTQAGNYQYGKYKIEVEMFDESGSWVVTKYVKICEPDPNNKTRNYGSLSAQLNGSCEKGKLYVIVDNVPTYNGALMESKVLSGTLEYPTSSGLPPYSFSTGNFSTTLFEGVYKLVAEICATYNFEDNVFVNVKYKVKKEKNIRCLIDRCCVLAALVELQGRTETDCTDAEKALTASIIVEALSLFEIAELSANCGEDPSPYIEKLEKLLGCKCTCNCAEGTPIIGTSPSSDIIIEGCNVEASVASLTKTYTINNYEYVVKIADNGGALVVSSATLNGCTKTQEITFDISVVYSQIKTLANQNNTEADYWASIIRKALRSDFTCIGLTQDQINALTLDGLVKAFVDFMCKCCGSGGFTCDATVENTDIVQSGNDVTLSWEGTAYSYDVYLDGVLKATILTSAYPDTPFSYTFIGAADNKLHTWTIISICSDGTRGQVESGEFQKLGCAEVSPVLMDEGQLTDGVVSAPCVFDLTSLVSLSNPETVEWHTANNTLDATLVSNPASVSGGTYYAFNKNGSGCYSISRRITVNCTVEGSCTAPRNLSVGVFGIYNFFVQFQSATYPPPGNSYTVKRRLASDPDVGGSYTTIGTPTWNASLNRWVIADLTAVDDTAYVYRAISNCGGTEPSIDYAYAHASCPSLVLYPTQTTVAYSFVPPATSPVGIYVEIYDSSGTSLIHRDVYTPAYSNPTEGIFEYLSPSTTYKVRLVIIYVDGLFKVQKDCPFQSIETDAA